MFQYLLGAAVLWNVVLSHPPDEMTMNQAIQEAATTSKSMDFLQSNDTVMMGLDMKVTLSQISEQSGSRTKRKALHGNRWENNIAYYERIPFARKEILAAFAEYEKLTCLKFKKRQRNNKNYFYIADEGGCSSYVGMIGGRQGLSLAPGCRYRSVIIHELGHAVGLQHEQTRQDRDDYVRIDFRNIPRDMAYNFNKNDVTNLGVKYSYTSIMHYDDRAFSTNGKRTIIAKDRKYQDKMGKSESFDFADLRIINIMYNCGGHCKGKRCPKDAYVSKECECMCPGNPVQKCGRRKRNEPEHVEKREAETQDRCEDTHTNQRECETWATEGNCHSTKYSYWMARNCMKTCGLCGDRKTFEASKKDCDDQFDKCRTWAAKGECESNHHYMHDYCKRSCNACGKPKRDVKCKDTNDACAAWAKKDMCDLNPDYMKETCAKSCNPECKK